MSTGSSNVGPSCRDVNGALSVGKLGGGNNWKSRDIITHTS